MRVKSAAFVPPNAQVTGVPAAPATVKVRVALVVPDTVTVPKFVVPAGVSVSGAYVIVPLSDAVCVPAASATESVATEGGGLAVSVPTGRNCTSMLQLAPGASVTCPSNWPPPAGPQVDSNRTIAQSEAFAPLSAPCAIVVSGTLPVLVNVKA